MGTICIRYVFRTIIFTEKYYLYMVSLLDIYNKFYWSKKKTTLLENYSTHKQK